MPMLREGPYDAGVRPGFWQCNSATTRSSFGGCTEYKRRNLPIDVIVCDFFHWPKMGDFRFDEEFFPDPQAMVAELKEMGIELMVRSGPRLT